MLVIAHTCILKSAWQLPLVLMVGRSRIMLGSLLKDEKKVKTNTLIKQPLTLK
jgi:hypothetical protein